MFINTDIFTAVPLPKNGYSTPPPLPPASTDFPCTMLDLNLLNLMMMKRYLFATQIIEHSAHSLLIRVDNGLF